VVQTGPLAPSESSPIGNQTGHITSRGCLILFDFRGHLAEAQRASW
jgi:hypothetical protein